MNNTQSTNNNTLYKVNSKGDLSMKKKSVERQKDNKRNNQPDIFVANM